MRIHDARGEPLEKVFVALTQSEAKELRDALGELVETGEKGAHWHVMDETLWRAPGEGERVEREVEVYRADDDSASF
jgi:hypothetical protein